MIKFLDLQTQYLGIKAEIDAAIASVIEQSAFIGGPGVAAFEREFAHYQQADHCVGVANGTDAIEIVLEALNLPRGSEVIVPANSFIATSEAVTRAGHRVVFADVDDNDYTLDVADVRKRITKRTAAIVVVHLYGCPADMDALMALGTEHGLKIIEDCAQAHGAEYHGRRVGGIGVAGTFSFYPGKNLGAYGDGGAIVTNDAALARQCRMIANHGRVEKYDHLFEGRNSRLDGLQAAILSVKLKHLDGWVASRNSVADAYNRAFGGIPGIITPGARAGCHHAYHLYVIRVADRDGLAAELLASNIQTGVHYPIALPKLRAYAYLDQANAPMRANAHDASVLSLPIGEHLSDDDVDAVIEVVQRFLR
ncbi:MAG: DegT/DnrJ/EryC1/StrS family aminotransferase [Gammaproteobacteria bacterium]